MFLTPAQQYTFSLKKIKFCARLWYNLSKDPYSTYLLLRFGTTARNLVRIKTK